MKIARVAACLLALSIPAGLRADDKARFDLVGPKIDVRVTRGTATLPIAEVPNLQAGDKIWVKADLPNDQSNHLLLIVAFLRGTTNEPPDNWFTEIDTWDKKTREGTTITVPNDAEQAIMFIAPETGGDFKTLRSAVKGKPGLFIRADADLNEASFEQQRIEHYLAAMKTVPPNDQKAIHDHSTKLAATLALKPDDKCFKEPVDQQVNCLTQSSAPVLMEDGHGQGIAEALSTGPSSDFINAASYTQPAGGGLYSAYVGAIVDLVHITTMLRTAQYQYIPAISFPQRQTLNLKLNAPPSFHKPETVMVIGLPAIQKVKPPPLRPHDPDQVACLLQPKMTLALEGAPLVFSTSLAHDLVLHLNRTGGPTDIPLTPDAFEGGLVANKEAAAGKEPHEPLAAAKASSPADPKVKVGSNTDLTITGTVRGYWGFDEFEGPTLTVQQVAGKNWKIVGDVQLMAGQENHLTLQGDGAACVQHIALASNKEKDVDVSFKHAGAKDAKDAKDSKDKDAKGDKNTLLLDVSLKTVEPGTYSLAIQQYGDANRDKVPLTAYSAAIQLDDIKIHAGDNATVLTGKGLDNVVSVQIGNQTFTPAGNGDDDKTVHLHAKEGVAPPDGSDATVKLKDGRTMTVNVAAAAARPGLKLLSFKATPAQQDGSIPVTLGAKDDIPLNGKLTFVVQTKEVFPHTQTIEVATANGAVHTTLSLASNNLVLQDDHTAIATLDPLKAFGQSAFGKLQMRPAAQDGTAGDWTPLGTLVRTPEIKAIHCTTPEAATCTVDGSNFFLVEAFSAAKDFPKPTEVPTGFAESTFTVPTPADGTTLYLKLRDDPSAVAAVTLPTPVQKPAAASIPAPQTTSPAANVTLPTHDAAPTNAPSTAPSVQKPPTAPAGGSAPAPAAKDAAAPPK
ncbi:MAG TPA: hypothetical protein VGN16_04210 [Acidobacteriaceae bacterium]|jgi:hypothetical protein